MNPATAMNTFTLAPTEGRIAPLNVLGESVLVKLSSADTNGANAVFQVDAAPMSGPPLHRHSREDEWFFVLEGEITVEVDGRRLVLRAGDAAFARRGTAHTYQNFSGQTARMLVLVTPGAFQGFFEQVAALNAGLAAPDLAGTERLMTEFGMELLGPPLG